MRFKSVFKGIGVLAAVCLITILGITTVYATTPGDANGSGAVDIDDAVYLVSYIFIGGPIPNPPETGDANCSYAIDIDDIVYLIAYVFTNGPEPCLVAAPSGDLTSHSSCKSFEGGARADTTPPTLDCMEWEYDGENTLLLKHVNAGLNCCPIIVAEIGIENNVITIEELDSLEGGGCDCNCLFDIGYEIIDLPPGEYTISVIEPYRLESEPPLIFTVDLVSSPTGIYCVPRYHYPWNY